MLKKKKMLNKNLTNDEITLVQVDIFTFYF